MTSPDANTDRDAQTLRFGMPLESALERRERFANRFDYDYGRERVFPELVEALLAEIPPGVRILEAGAATGLLTEPLLARAGHVTALEPSEGMLRRLLAKKVAESPRLRVLKGLAEDLAPQELFEIAVVTFTPRRGVGLFRLLQVLAMHVTDKVVMLIDDDAAMDWAFLARAAAQHGFETSLRLIASWSTEGAQGEAATPPRVAAILTARPTEHLTPLDLVDAWEIRAPVLEVPYPAPRGTATRLVRYFLAGGERAILIKTEQPGIERLYGNLRTATHRLARDEITVRRVDEGIQLVRLPKSAE